MTRQLLCTLDQKLGVFSCPKCIFFFKFVDTFGFLNFGYIIYQYFFSKIFLLCKMQVSFESASQYENVFSCCNENNNNNNKWRLLKHQRLLWTVMTDLRLSDPRHRKIVFFPCHLNFTLLELKVISLCHQFRARPAYTPLHFNQALYWWLTNIIDMSKNDNGEFQNERWIIPFKKLRLRVKCWTNLESCSVMWDQS